MRAGLAWTTTDVSPLPCDDPDLLPDTSKLATSSGTLLGPDEPATVVHNNYTAEELSEVERWLCFLVNEKAPVLGHLLHRPQLNISSLPHHSGQHSEVYTYLLRISGAVVETEFVKEEKMPEGAAEEGGEISGDSDSIDISKVKSGKKEKSKRSATPQKKKK